MTDALTSHDTHNALDIAAITQRIDRPIVLVGLMGAGKSTVGRKLAAMLDRPFIDADDAIEDAAQRSIAEIFEEFGEDYFRDGERRVIARLLEAETGIIATGGGAFINDATRALILKRAIAVWIDCSIDTLVERTARRDTRPLLKAGDPREILARLYEERRAHYEKAQVKVMSEDGPHAQTARAIIAAIEEWMNR